MLSGAVSVGNKVEVRFTNTNEEVAIHECGEKQDSVFIKCNVAVVYCVPPSCRNVGFG